MKNDNSGLLIAALVAIVAVVGLVILFKGGTTGNAVCPPGYDMAQNQNYGGQGYFGCIPNPDYPRIIPQQVADPNYVQPSDTFQTHQQGEDRRLAIAQRTWEY